MDDLSGLFESATDFLFFKINENEILKIKSENQKLKSEVDKLKKLSRLKSAGIGL